MTIYAIIVAGGTGSRFGSSVPKQFLDLGGKPVLCHTLQAFRDVIPLSRIVTVVSGAMTTFWKELCDTAGIDPGPIAIGGDTRWESVKNGLEALGDIDADDIVLVHDGARPLAGPEFICAIAGALQSTDADGVIPAMPLTDSIRRISADGVFFLMLLTVRATDPCRPRRHFLPENLRRHSRFLTGLNLPMRLR